MRNISLDFLKLILSVFVVLIHLEFLKGYNQEVSYTLVNGVFRVAVPTFLVINGFYLSKIFGSPKFYPHIKKLVVLYILWMAIYYKYWAVSDSIKDIITIATFGYYQLWYIPGLILSALVLNKLRGVSTQNLIILSLSLYAVGVIIQFIGNYNATENLLPEGQLRIVTYRNFLFDCFPFLCFGFIINRVNLIQRMSDVSTGMHLTACITAFLLIFIESRFNAYVFGTQKYIDLLIFTIPCSITLFLFFNKIVVHGVSNIVSNFASAIFFTHLLCIHMSTLILPELNTNSQMVYYALVVILTITTSVLLVALKRMFNKMPLLQ